MNKKLLKNIKEWVWILVIFVFISFFIYQPFKIPSGSMIPTLLVGDFLIVNKYCYGYSNDSMRIGTFTLPFPTLHKRLFGLKPPQYGDVVVFHNDKDDDLNYIKRIIGLPGDVVQLKEGIVYINEKPLGLEQMENFSIVEDGEYRIYRRFMETMPNGYKHVIIKACDFGKASYDNAGPYVVPEEHYFVMGDNRDCSKDSRVMESCGFIHSNRIMGRAEGLFFSSTCKLYEILKWPFSIRYERIFTRIR
ncbi:MAG: signal peptidase I [Holosporales bacterium]|jgi:signal peptidase I|nr:signal peptidase I [Holosporales bacterium]